MKYDGEMQVGGRLANAGQRLIDSASKSMIAQGLESLNSALKTRLLAEEEGIDIEYVPPSEAEFAAAVAKDVAREMLPPAQMAGIALAVAAVVLLLFFLLRRDED
jgi:hypothetical protein